MQVPFQAAAKSEALESINIGRRPVSSAGLNVSAKGLLKSLKLT